MKKKVRKPREIDGIFWDFYYQQFSEPGDKMEISININDISFENTKGDVKKLRSFIKHLSKCADYLESRD